MSAAHIDILTGRPDAVVVAVSGEIDLAVHEAFLESLESAIKTADVEQAGKVVVDLTDTSFLDSTGIRVLIQGQETAAAAGVGYTVTGASGLVHRVLTVTGVLDLLSRDSQPTAADPTA